MNEPAKSKVLEAVHLDANNLLMKILSELGMNDIVDAYTKVGK